MENNHEFRVILTPFCNYRCFFCHKEGLNQPQIQLLLHPEDYRFVATAARELWGWETMTLTGGEPLISPIFQQTVEQLADAGIRLTVITNGSLLSSPRRQLKHIAQVNVSLHTLDSAKYHIITDENYSPEDIAITVRKIRQQLPDIEIHLNSTVIRGYNDDLDTMAQLINLAREINGQAKFIDLASDDKILVVPVKEIAQRLEQLGFIEVDHNLWQIVMQRGDERAFITRCGFAREHQTLALRNLLLHPDGIATVGNDDFMATNVLAEIKSRDQHAFGRKIERIFPPSPDMRLYGIKNQ